MLVVAVTGCMEATTEAESRRHHQCSAGRGISRQSFTPNTNTHCPEQHGFLSHRNFVHTLLLQTIQACSLSKHVAAELVT